MLLENNLMDNQIEIQLLAQKVKLILQELKQYDNEIVYLENLENFYKKLDYLYDKVPIYYRINHSNLFEKISKTLFVLGNLFELKENYELSKKAMDEYNSFDKNDERNIIEWLLKYENDFFISDDVVNVYDYWFKLKPIKENLIIDCSKYSVSYDFSNKYWEFWGEIFAKYRPKEKDLDKIQNHEIPHYLVFHNKYIDILEKYKKLQFKPSL